MSELRADELLVRLVVDDTRTAQQASRQLERETAILGAMLVVADAFVSEDHRRRDPRLGRCQRDGPVQRASGSRGREDDHFIRARSR